MVELIFLHATLVLQLMNGPYHRATKAECNAAYYIELSEMNKAGIFGDPSISLGEAMGSIGSHGMQGISMNPCGYVGNGEFYPRYTKDEENKEVEISKCDYFRLKAKYEKCIEGDCWEGCKVD